MMGSFRRLLARMCDPKGSAEADPVEDPVASTTRTLQRLTISKSCHERQKSPASTIRDDSILDQQTFRLPPELMAEIFATVCHADSDKFLHDKARRKKTTPLILGAVCGHWRDVIWGTPHIWSHISINLSKRRYQTQADLLEVWLAKSGVCPLTMNLVFIDEDEWTEFVPEKLIQLLMDNAYRWRSVNFVLPEGWYPLLEPCKDDFRMLTRVSTQPLWADCSLSPSKRKKLKLFREAPLLQDLHLNGYYLSDVTIPWEQLTRVTLQHVYLDECFYALPQVPNLTWLKIYTILINDVDRTVIETSITLPLLQKLVIYSSTWGDTTRLLCEMSFPSLQDFELSAPADHMILHELPSILTNGMSSITRLSFTEVKIPLDEDKLLQFFKSMPLVEELVIDLHVSNTNAFHFLFFLDLLKEYPVVVTSIPDTHRTTGSTESHSSSPSPSPSTSRSRLESSSEVHRPIMSSPFLLPNLETFQFTGPVTMWDTPKTLATVTSPEAEVERDVGADDANEGDAPPKTTHLRAKNDAHLGNHPRKPTPWAFDYSLLAVLRLRRSEPSTYDFHSGSPISPNLTPTTLTPTTPILMSPATIMSTTTHSTLTPMSGFKRRRLRTFELTRNNHTQYSMPDITAGQEVKQGLEELREDGMKVNILWNEEYW